MIRAPTHTIHHGKAQRRPHLHPRHPQSPFSSWLAWKNPASAPRSLRSTIQLACPAFQHINQHAFSCGFFWRPRSHRCSCKDDFPRRRSSAITTLTCIDSYCINIQTNLNPLNARKEKGVGQDKLRKGSIGSVRWRRSKSVSAFLVNYTSDEDAMIPSPGARIYQPPFPPQVAVRSKIAGSLVSLAKIVPAIRT